MAKERLGHPLERLAPLPFSSLGAQAPNLLGGQLDEVVLELALVLDVPLDFPLLDPVEGRLGDEQVSPLHEGRHLAEEKGEEQGPNVGPVHVGVRHDDDPVVPKARDVEIVPADAAAERRDEDLDLLRGEHLVGPGLLHVQDLPLEGKNGLAAPVPALLGRAAG